MICSGFNRDLRKVDIYQADYRINSKFYTHQTSGACAGVCTCNCMHQMEKTVKDCLPFNLVSGVVYKYISGMHNSSYYSETSRHLNVRSGKPIEISTLTFRKVKPSKDCAILDHLLTCNNIS